MHAETPLHARCMHAHHLAHNLSSPENLVNFNASSGKSENWHFDELFFSIAYKVSAKKVQNYLSWHWRLIEALKKNLTFCLKNYMKNLVNFNASSGKSENLHFDGLLLLKVCNFGAKKIQRSCVVKNDLWFQKWQGIWWVFTQVVEKILDKSSVYIFFSWRNIFFGQR